MGRKILAGILGGIAFFAWSSIAHLATDLGQPDSVSFRMSKLW